MKQMCLLFAFCLIPLLQYGQDFSLDSLIQSDKLPLGWRVELTSNVMSSDKKDNELVGRVSFYNGNHYVHYKVYNMVVLSDSIFKQEELYSQLYSSCVNYFGSMPYAIGTFTIGEFYFSGELCPRLSDNRKCRKLAKYLHEVYIDSCNIVKIEEVEFSIPDLKIHD